MLLNAEIIIADNPEKANACVMRTRQKAHSRLLAGSSQLNYRGLLSIHILLFCRIFLELHATAASKYARDVNFSVFILVTRVAQGRNAPTREARYRLSHRPIIRYPQRGKYRKNSGTLLPPEIRDTNRIREDVSAKIFLISLFREISRISLEQRQRQPRASYRQSRTR